MFCSVVQILRLIDGDSLHLRTLGEVKLRCDRDGNVIYNVGNSAVVFTCWHQKRWHSLKCYTSKSPLRLGIYGSKLLTDELYVPQYDGRGEWIDLLLEEWVEGVSLSQYIEEAVERLDTTTLRELSKEFDKMAYDLLTQEWAHGDITCENIIVDAQGGLHLIDLDGSYMPQFEGMTSSELGTAAYQSPLRDATHFNRFIDDYSLALISTAIALIAHDRSIYREAPSLEGLLFNPSEILRGESKIFDKALRVFANAGEALSYNIATLLSYKSVELPRLHYLLRYKVEGIHPLAQPSTIFSRDGRWGYLNEFGREAIPPLFDSAFDFCDSIAAVKLASSWHYIDKQARVVLNCSGFKAIKSARNGVARMLLEDGSWHELPICTQEAES